MFETIHFLTTLALSLFIGNLLYIPYQILIRRLADTVGKDLRKETSGLFETGLLVIGSIDLLGSGALSFGIFLCFMAVVLDFIIMITSG